MILFLKSVPNYKSPIFQIIILFTVWRLTLFLVAYFAENIIPQFNASFPYIEELVNTNLPSWIWGFGNFDGVHYIRIAKAGYSEFTQAFFPLYPLLISLFAFGKHYLISGLIISNLSFIAFLLIFYKLLRIDYEKKVALKTIILILCFPTSFYFGAVYTEAIFILLVVLTFYLLRKKMFFVGGFFAAFVSATRIVGVLIIPSLTIELYKYLRENKIKLSSELSIKAILGIALATFGFLLYLLYQYLYFKDALFFLHAQPLFGASRSAEPFILLPQVFFRYFKILTSLPIQNYQFFTAASEVAFTILFIFLLIYSFRKIRFSYWLFCFFVFITPTLTGTFLSMPRFVLACIFLFPSLVLVSGKFYKIMLTIFVMFQLILLSLFVRGHWVA